MILNGNNNDSLNEILKKHIMIGDRIRIKNMIRQERQNHEKKKRSNKIMTDNTSNCIKNNILNTNVSNKQYLYFNDKLYREGEKLLEKHGKLLKYIDNKPFILNKEGWMFVKHEQQLIQEELLSCPFNCKENILKSNIEHHCLTLHIDELNKK